MRRLTAGRVLWVLLLLGALVVAVAGLALSAGPSGLSLQEVWGVLSGERSEGPAADIVLRVRLPRVQLGLCVGAALAVGLILARVYGAPDMPFFWFAIIYVVIVALDRFMARTALQAYRRLALKLAARLNETPPEAD